MLTDSVLQFAIVTGSALLTDKQKLWRSLILQATSMRPQRLARRPSDRFRWLFPCTTWGCQYLRCKCL